MFVKQINNKTIEFRNLEEQVQKNKEDIERHYEINRVLADFGIKIVGVFANASFLNNVTGEEYGDAYAIGSVPPYDYYVWTRANNESSEDYWFNIGKLAIPGPQGPQGIEGQRGADGQSTKWDIGSTAPVASSSYKTGDLYVNASNGALYYFNGINWVMQGSIKGPQGPSGPQGIQGPVGPIGPVGPQGERGPAGGFIRILGILNSTSELPSPQLLQDPNAAYLIISNLDGLKYLYIQIGDRPEVIVWSNVGVFNSATAVFDNAGVYQSSYNMSVKQDTLTDSVTIKKTGNELNIAPNIMTDIARSLKIPTSTIALETIPVYNIQTQRVDWVNKNDISAPPIYLYEHSIRFLVKETGSTNIALRFNYLSNSGDPINNIGKFIDTFLNKMMPCGGLLVSYNMEIYAFAIEGSPGSLSLTLCLADNSFIEGMGDESFYTFNINTESEMYDYYVQDEIRQLI